MADENKPTFVYHQKVIAFTCWFGHTLFFRQVSVSALNLWPSWSVCAMQAKQAAVRRVRAEQRTEIMQAVQTQDWQTAQQVQRAQQAQRRQQAQRAQQARPIGPRTEEETHAAFEGLKVLWVFWSLKLLQVKECEIVLDPAQPCPALPSPAVLPWLPACCIVP